MRLQRSSRRRVSLVAVVASLAVVCADHEPGHPGNVHNPILVLETSMGTMKAELFLDAMPITVSNIVDLTNKGFYDGLHFHRIIENFMDQFGCPFSADPTSWKAGRGGPDAQSTYKNLATGDTITRGSRGGIPDEFIVKITNGPGTLSMANTGQPNTGGSQFFINVHDNKFLDWWDTATPSKHPVFGEIVEGYEEVAVAISKASRDRYDRPITPIKVIKASILGIYGQAAACAEKVIQAEDESEDVRRRQLETAMGEAGWFGAWRTSLECWWVTLPIPTQTQLGGCVGAVGLHLSSRFDAALARVGATAAPGAREGVAAESECEWVPQRLEQLQLPTFPQIDGVRFTLPPLPELQFSSTNSSN